MKVAVIGANSFSGNDLIELLLNDKNNEVLGISRSPARRSPSYRYLSLQADLNTGCENILDHLATFAPDVIVNFAAQSEVMPSWKHPEHFFRTNVTSLATFINGVRQLRNLQKYVHISSPEVYGSCHGETEEEARFNPSTPYAASKAAADLLLSVYAKQGLPLVTLRSTNVYGAGQQLWKLIPKTILAFREGNKVTLNGGGTSIKSYLHVRDMNRGVLAAMQHGKVGEVYHLSPDRSDTVGDIVGMLAVLMNVDFTEMTTVGPARLGVDSCYIIDSTKARTELGWKPEIPINLGLMEVVGWLDEKLFIGLNGAVREYVHHA